MIYGSRAWCGTSDLPTEGIVFKDLMLLIGDAEGVRADDPAPGRSGHGRVDPT